MVQASSKPQDTPTDPSSYLREVLRTPGAGETQLQATLVRIECEPKGMVFVVQTASGLLRLRTASFDDIEITTYDPKVAGDITCGARKPENTVIVCYLPNTDKRVKADGVLKSIEFVPADFKLKVESHPQITQISSCALRFFSFAWNLCNLWYGFLASSSLP